MSLCIHVISISKLLAENSSPVTHLVSLLKLDFQKEHGLASILFVAWQPLERLWGSAGVVAVAEVDVKEFAVGAVVHMMIIIIITIMTVIVVGAVVVVGEVGVVPTMVVGAGTRVGMVAVVIFKTKFNARLL